MDIKSWLETTGINTKELRFLKAPNYPYIVFNDAITVRGTDNMLHILTEHVTSVELYTKSINQDDSSTKIEELILDDLNVEFTRQRVWVEEESHFLTIYNFTFLEKERRHKNVR